MAKKYKLFKFFMWMEEDIDEHSVVVDLRGAVFYAVLLPLLGAVVGGILTYLIFNG